MRFYHYTSIALVDGILLTDLSLGHLNMIGEVIKPVVWLTTDPKAEGHGMTTGAENLSDANMASLTRVDGVRPRNRHTHNKTMVRLTFDVPDEAMPQLQRFTDFCDTVPNGKWLAKWTGLSCYINMETADAKRIKSLMKSHPTKERTWWISFLPVSARFITAVELRGHDGKYQPYEFEKIVRPAMAELGFFAPSQQARVELKALVEPSHPLAEVEAYAICPGQDVRPFVAVRGTANDLWFEIETCKPLTKAAADAPRVSAWVAAHSDDLLRAWNLAQESYFSFYPEKRASTL